MSVSNLEISDSFNIVNALAGGGPTPVPATVSFDVEWSGEQERFSLRNEELRFAGDFVLNTATLSWSAENEDGFSYKADPLSVGFAELGSMRNGRFFG
jgi:hypothetical protein